MSFCLFVCLFVCLIWMRFYWILSVIVVSCLKSCVCDCWCHFFTQKIVWWVLYKMGPTIVSQREFLALDVLLCSFCFVVFCFFSQNVCCLIELIYVIIFLFYFVNAFPHKLQILSSVLMHSNWFLGEFLLIENVFIWLFVLYLWTIYHLKSVLIWFEWFLIWYYKDWIVGFMCIWIFSWFVGFFFSSGDCSQVLHFVVLLFFLVMFFQSIFFANHTTMTVDCICILLFVGCFFNVLLLVKMGWF